MENPRQVRTRSIPIAPSSPSVGIEWSQWQDSKTRLHLGPDFTSTAFMIQGATLQAGLADCGDVTDVVGSSDAMTGYVILSRLTAATGLLLLRAFSPVLFRQGEPPGPCVLLKWMRSRFCKETEAAEYTFDQVLTEYAELNKQMTSDRQQRKLRGMLQVVNAFCSL